MTTAAFSAAGAALPSRTVYENHYADVRIPERPLAPGALEIVKLANHSEAEKNVSHAMHKIRQLWSRQSSFPVPYLVYGKEKLQDTSFTWQMVPYKANVSLLARLWQQFIILWRITFGASKLTSSALQSRITQEHATFNQLPPLPLEGQEEDIQLAPQDPFCTTTNIQRQRVYEGKKINVLLSHAPLGKQKLHFLFTTKRHIDNFDQLTAEEFLEIRELAARIIRRLKQESLFSNLQVAEHFFKTGKVAGQTVSHFHYQMVLTSSVADGIFGKLGVLKNILFGSRPMQEETFLERVADLSRYLSALPPLPVESS